MSPLSDSSTIRFYDDRGDEYIRDTVNVDMGALYQPFLELVPEGCEILDAGCGSGRDSKAFLDFGYRVTAVDASAKMVEASTRLIGLPTRHLRFQELEATDEFDGIWACASLLHVPLAELHDVLATFATALRIGGVCYLSFKEGDGERVVGSRQFTDFTEDGLRATLQQQPAFNVLQIWITNDLRTDRIDERWVNALIRKV